jgi:hypothetical protein
MTLFNFFLSFQIVECVLGVISLLTLRITNLRELRMVRMVGREAEGLQSAGRLGGGGLCYVEANIGVFPGVLLVEELHIFRAEGEYASEIGCEQLVAEFLYLA